MKALLVGLILLSSTAVEPALARRKHGAPSCRPPGADCAYGRDDLCCSGVCRGLGGVLPVGPYHCY